VFGVPTVSAAYAASAASGRGGLAVMGPRLRRAGRRLAHRRGVPEPPRLAARLVAPGLRPRARPGFRFGRASGQTRLAWANPPVLPPLWRTVFPAWCRAPTFEFVPRDTALLAGRRGKPEREPRCRELRARGPGIRRDRAGSAPIVGTRVGSSWFESSRFESSRFESSRVGGGDARERPEAGPPSPGTRGTPRIASFGITGRIPYHLCLAVFSSAERS